MNYKKTKSVVSVILAFCLIFLSMVPVFAVEPEPMSDVPQGHWAYESVMNMVRQGVISGYPDGTFKPDKAVTREEFARMLCGATSIPLAQPKTNYFEDITPDAWSFRYVETVKDYLTGYPSTTGRPLFKGRQDATREDIAVALVKIKGFDKTTLPNPNIIDDMFKDGYSISSNLKNMVAIAIEKKLMGGFPDNTIRGTDVLTRAQAAVLIDKANKIAGDVKDIIAPTKSQVVLLSADSNKSVGKVGEKLQGYAKVVYSNGQSRDVTNEVVWSVSDSSILTVNDSGDIFLKKEGSAVVSAQMDGNSDHFDITVLPKATQVTSEIKQIRLTPSSVEMKQNDAVNMRAEAIYENGRIVDVTESAKWWSNDKAIVQVDNSGKVVALNKGVTLVKALYKDYCGYSAVSVAESVYSLPDSPRAEITLDSISLSHSYKEIKKGNKATVTAIATYSNRSKKNVTESVVWTVEDESVAVISSKGHITAISEGVTKITATKDGKSSHMYVVVTKK